MPDLVVDPLALFDQAKRVSRFWLPSLLDNLASVPATQCHADGCDIFLLARQRLYLAGTTRRELKHRLYDERLSYTTDQEDLREAASQYETQKADPTARVRADAGLSGWCAAFDRPIRLADVRSRAERDALAKPSDAVPPPVWGSRMRGFFDYGIEEKRPFLVVPMRDKKGQAVGVVRLVTTRRNAVAFEEQQEEDLQNFADSLGHFLVEHGLLQDDMRHYFRIWAARGSSFQLAQRITEAVPELLDVDCCSFFQRDSEERFVLQHSGCSPSMTGPTLEDFREFRDTNVDNLYYEEGSAASNATVPKTSICIQRQSAVYLRRRGRSAEWEAFGEDLVLSQATEGKFLKDKPRIHCEINAARNRHMLLAPVRAADHPRLLAGMIRVVSAKNQDNLEYKLRELVAFADDLGACLAETSRRIRQSALGRDLMVRVHSGEVADLWSEGAKVIAELVDADSATIFVLEESQFVSKREQAFLNENQIRLDQGPGELERNRAAHEKFCTELEDFSYRAGEGRTGWCAKHREVLNLADLEDLGELSRKKVRAHSETTTCELAEPGSFIAAPIFRGPEGKVCAIVRALRTRHSMKGAFSPTEGLTLETGATMLGALAHSAQRDTVVVSYSFVQPEVKDRLVELLDAAGVRAVYLPSDPDEEDPRSGISKFVELTRVASAGVVIGTPGAGAGLSQAVAGELAILCTAFEKQVAVIRPSTLTLDRYYDDVTQISFEFDPKDPKSIDSVLAPLIIELQRWRADVPSAG